MSAETQGPDAATMEAGRLVGRAMLAKLWTVWRLDDDLMTCRECKRSLHVTRDGEMPSHRAGCSLVGAKPVHPWAMLRAALDALAAEAEG